ARSSVLLCGLVRRLMIEHNMRTSLRCTLNRPASHDPALDGAVLFVVVLDDDAVLVAEEAVLALKADADHHGLVLRLRVWMQACHPRARGGGDAKLGHVAAHEFH